MWWTRPSDKILFLFTSLTETSLIVLTLSRHHSPGDRGGEALIKMWMCLLVSFIYYLGFK